MKPIHIVIAVLACLFVSVLNAQAQNPVNIRQVGDVSIGATVPVSGTISAPTGGLPVTPAICSGATCFTIQGVTGSAVAINITTSQPFGTTTTLVQGILVNNSCATAVQVTIADGNNKPFLGSENASNGTFSVPSLGQLPEQMGLVGYIFTNGLNVSAVGSSNCLYGWFAGHQCVLPSFPFLWLLRRRKTKAK